MTDRLAVIGDPIAHSLSPAIQAAALTAAGLNWSYEALQVRASDLGSCVQGLRVSGYRGFNVTIPHKQAIRPYLDGEARSAARVGAVNTIVRAGDALVGHNTDLKGFHDALQAVLPEPFGIPAVVFGAGGAARAVVSSLADLGGRITIVNRSAAPAQRLAAVVEGAIARAPDDLTLLEDLATARLVVNATPLGMGHLADLSPLPRGASLFPGAFVMDLVYGYPTPLLQQARERGCRVADGLEMLVRQGAESFRLWTGIEADLAAMRIACHHRLGELQPC